MEIFNATGGISLYISGRYLMTVLLWIVWIFIRHADLMCTESSKTCCVTEMAVQWNALLDVIDWGLWSICRGSHVVYRLLFRFGGHKIPVMSYSSQTVSATSVENNIPFYVLYFLILLSIKCVIYLILRVHVYTICYKYGLLF